MSHSECALGGTCRRPARTGTESLWTLCWRGMDSNFQYAGAVNLIVASLFSPRAFHRVRTAGGLDIERRAVQSLVVRTQADRLILHVATACAEDVADIGAAGQVTHTEP